MVVETPLPKHSKRNVELCVGVLAKVCRIFGFHGEYNPEADVDHWFNLVKTSTGKDWMKVAKYKLAAFYAYHTNQTLPEKPFSANDFPGALFRGRMGRFVRLFLKRSSPIERMSFLSSLKQAKKGMPRPNRSYILEKVEQTKRKLTTKKPEVLPENGGWLRNWSELTETVSDDLSLVINRASAEKQIRRTVKEIFSNHPMKTSDRVHAFFPSTSANYIMSRSKAGAIGAILEHPTLLRGLRKPGGYLGFQHKVEEEQISNTEDWIEVNENGKPEFSDAFTLFWLRLLAEADRDENDIELLGLPEALKVRVITKGSPYIQTVLKSLQRHMHTTLRKHKTFQLIGKPVSEKIILDSLGANLKPEEVYISGDYEDATNNMYSWVSRVTADAVADEIKLYDVERRLFVANLVHNVIEGAPQEEGQTMGSITSFPVLCLANAAICRWAMEVATMKKTLLRDAPLLINGDDCAFRTTPDAYTHWKRISEFFGLKESVGKTYVSKSFVEINSTQFLRVSPYPFTDFKTEKTITILPHGKFVKEDQIRVVRQNMFRQVPSVNMGLLIGLKRSGAGSQGLYDPAIPYSYIGTRYREFMRTSPEWLQEEMHKMFIQYNRKLLDNAKPLPWYMPSWIGGLGLTGVREPSEKDLRLATRILQNWKHQRPQDLGNATDKPWKTWLLAQQYAPEPTVVSKRNTGVDMYNSIIARKCIDLLFDSNLSLADLLKISESNVGSIVAVNKKFWRMPHGPLPNPIDQTRLPYQSSFLSYKNEHTSFTKVPTFTNTSTLD
jgi:hypothetical protein